jgi:hypothetical protein
MLYRIYSINADDRIVRRDDFGCESDNEAITRASDHQGSSPAMEVWEGTRRVARIGMAVRETNGSPNSDSKSRLLLRSPTRAVSEHRRLAAEHAELRDEMRQLREKNEKARAQSEAVGTPTRRVLHKQ